MFYIKNWLKIEILKVWWCFSLTKSLFEIITTNLKSAKPLLKLLPSLDKAKKSCNKKLVTKKILINATILAVTSLDIISYPTHDSLLPFWISSIWEKARTLRENWAGCVFHFVTTKSTGHLSNSGESLFAVALYKPKAPKTSQIYHQWRS